MEESESEVIGELETIGYNYAMSLIEEMVDELIASDFDVATLEALREKIRIRQWPPQE
jgi:hypothetical protein